MNRPAHYLMTPILVLTVGIGLTTFIEKQNFQALAANANHVVISQVKIAGATAGDEFIELYNPTDAPVDLSGWRLTRKSASSSTQTNLVASLSGTLAPRSYYLIANPASPLATDSADAVYSASSSAITTNNTILLYSDASTTLVDKVGFGTAADNESAPFATSPEENQSIIRKASTTSTQESLIPGGSEATAGNGEDTDNNATDFLLLNASQPRNTDTAPTTSGSPTPTTSVTPTVTITPTITPTETTTPTPTTIQTVTPTMIPTATPTLTNTITPTPTVTATPTTTVTPTVTVTPTGTMTPTPSTNITPSATTTPSPTVTPTPVPDGTVVVDEKINDRYHLVCIQRYGKITVLGKEFTVPCVKCTLEKIKDAVTHREHKERKHVWNHKSDRHENEDENDNKEDRWNDERKHNVDEDEEDHTWDEDRDNERNHDEDDEDEDHDNERTRDRNRDNNHHDR